MATAFPTGSDRERRWLGFTHIILNRTTGHCLHQVASQIFIPNPWRFMNKYSIFCDFLIFGGNPCVLQFVVVTMQNYLHINTVELTLSYWLECNLYLFSSGDTIFQGFADSTNWKKSIPCKGHLFSRAILWVSKAICSSSKTSKNLGRCSKIRQSDLSCTLL